SGVERQAVRDSRLSQSANETKWLGLLEARTSDAETSPFALSLVHSRKSVQRATNSSSLPALTIQFPELRCCAEGDITAMASTSFELPGRPNRPAAGQSRRSSRYRPQPFG